MAEHELQELCRRKRDQLVRLMEISDLTREMQTAAERRDEVSLNMLLSMREAPLRQMQEIEQGIQDYLLTLPEDEAILYSDLLSGEEKAEEPEEEPLCEQVAKYHRLLASVIEMDKRMSLHLGGKQSFYKTFRE